MGNNYGKETKMLMVHPRDVAEVTVSELQESFTGKSYSYVVGEDCNIGHLMGRL